MGAADATTSSSNSGSAPGARICNAADSSATRDYGTHGYCGNGGRLAECANDSDSALTNNSTSSNTPVTRDYGFDNLKGTLIYLVVLGHMLSSVPHVPGSALFDNLRPIIYSFHIFAFAFISGYFTKRSTLDVPYFKKLVGNVLVPFLLVNTIMLVITGHGPSAFLHPQYTMWYLLSLFCWRLLVIPFSRFKFCFVLAVFLSLYIGFTDANTFLSISRTIAFFPCFLLGYLMPQHGINKLRQVHPAIPAMGIVAAFVVVVALNHLVPAGFSLFHSLMMYAPYETMPVPGWYAMLIRAAGLALGMFITLCLVSLVTEDKTFLAALGSRSIVVYLLHGMIIKGTAMLLPEGAIIQNDLVAMGIAIAIAALLCALLGNRFVESAYKKVLGAINAVVLKD